MVRIANMATIALLVVVLAASAFVIGQRFRAGDGGGEPTQLAALAQPEATPTQSLIPTEAPNGLQPVQPPTAAECTVAPLSVDQV